MHSLIYNALIFIYTYTLLVCLSVCPFVSNIKIGEKTFLENGWIFFLNAPSQKEKSAKICKWFKMADFYINCLQLNFFTWKAPKL